MDEEKREDKSIMFYDPTSNILFTSNKTRIETCIKACFDEKRLEDSGEIRITKEDILRALGYYDNTPYCWETYEEWLERTNK